MNHPYTKTTAGHVAYALLWGLLGVFVILWPTFFGTEQMPAWYYWVAGGLMCVVGIASRVSPALRHYLQRQSHDASRARTPDDLSRIAKRDFALIQENWKRELEHNPWLQELHWLPSDPTVLTDQQLIFMFKEARIISTRMEVAVEGETAEAYIEATGYAVAMRTDGRWVPTRIFIMEKNSPEEALAEMQNIGDGEPRSTGNSNQ